MAEPGDPQPPAPSKAGRNLPAAIASGVILGGIVALSLFTVKWTFLIVVAVALVIAVWEMTGALAQAGIRVTRTPLVLAGIATAPVAYLWGTEALLAAVGATVLLILVWRIRRGHEGYVRDVTASVFVLGYLPLMAGFVGLTLAADNGVARVITFILLTICNDIGGYAAGVLFGRHPIAPTISPKKSWEGFAGSIALQILVGILTFVFLLDGTWWQGVIAAVVLTITATAGDFAESAIKRDLGVKDMGNLLPGHGGLMDRLDSLIPNVFASWAIFTILLGSGT